MVVIMIKKVKYNVFDVFFGTGWDNWIRMELKDDWIRIGGDPQYTKNAKNLLSTTISKKGNTHESKS
jgi:hypothetical protein